MSLIQDNEATEHDIFAGYRPALPVYDEMVFPDGSVRDHWASFVKSLENLGREDLNLRRESARHIIREHGVSYNVYGDPLGMDRPWELDMLPLVIPPNEWRVIETGLIQRANLFNLILSDLYGSQRLIHERLLPASLIFSNPNFIRPCAGIQVPQNIFLHLHAADLARSPDGTWWVLSDRTQAPSGAGYALENRIVLSRTLPDEFRNCQVQRLASFFRVKRDSLRSLAPRNKDNPNVVLLTPGPHNETYFEHAYLARYLGFMLVEGNDLTVRDRRVFIKTLGGLQPVDVILRRVDSTFCDPLELRGDSFLGIAGLLEAVRAGNVAVANALGSGVIESPALLPFLPNLCRHFLGEELMLPSVATWWCGRAKERAYLEEQLGNLVVKSSFASSLRDPIFGGSLSASDREQLISRIEARPGDFVAQEQVSLSTAPAWVNGTLESRPLVLRTYTASNVDSYEVMPGGLTRFSAKSQDPVVSMQSGGGSKDTWVLSEGPVPMITLLTQARQPIRSNQPATEIPSRVADNLFWLGRYVERLESSLRIVRCVITRLVDETSGENSPELASIVKLLLSLGLLSDRFKSRIPISELEKAIQHLIYDQNRIGSVHELLIRLRSIASSVRDRFSNDTWRILNELRIETKSKTRRIPLSETLGLTNKLIIGLSAFSGMEMENMTRGHGWRFLDFGRRLERGCHIANLLNGMIASLNETNAILEPVLEIADSVMTFRRRYFTQLQPAIVLDLLLKDKGNPRSLAFQIHALKDHANHLPKEKSSSDLTEENKRIAEILVALNNFTFSSDSEDCPLLEKTLQQIVSSLFLLSDQITRRYFTHTTFQVS